MEALKKGAEIYFKDNQDLQVIFASPDGQYFYDEGRCLAYCVNNKLGKPVVIDREAPQKKETTKKKVENGSVKKGNSK